MALPASGGRRGRDLPRQPWASLGVGVLGAFGFVALIFLAMILLSIACPPRGRRAMTPSTAAQGGRFPQLSAEHSSRIVVPSTPARHVHLRRRHPLADVKKPVERLKGVAEAQERLGPEHRPGDDGPSLVRVEQPYPLPAKDLQAALDTELIWAQEEREKIGSWPFMERELRVLDL